VKTLRKWTLRLEIRKMLSTVMLKEVMRE
jgi:2-phosphoglycerate kinase